MIIYFRVPYDKEQYAEFLNLAKIKVIRDYRPVKRPMIFIGDGIESISQPVKMRVMTVLTDPTNKDYYIVGAANKWLSFNEIVLDYFNLELYIATQEEINTFNNYKNKGG